MLRRGGERRPQRDPRRRRTAAKLREGSLGDALLDALPQEPLPPESLLWDTPNLIITPHCGLYHPTAYGPCCLDGFFANFLRLQPGEPLAHRVLPTCGYELPEIAGGPGEIPSPAFLTSMQGHIA